MSHSESQPTQTKHSLKEKALRASGVVSLAVASYGAGLATHAELSQPNSNVVAERMHREAIKVSVAEDVAKNRATNVASSFAETLSRGMTVKGMRVLNGQIELMGKNGVYTPIIRNPILLTTVDPTIKPDKDGSFLEGGYFGIQGRNGQEITITPQLYDSAAYRFVPNDPNDIVFQSISVYSTAFRGGPGLPMDELVAIDGAGNPLQNPDNTVVSPGLSEAMK